MNLKISGDSLDINRNVIIYNTKETVGIKGELGNVGMKIQQKDATKEVYKVKPN